MGGKQMEGDNRERREKAKESRKSGKKPSEDHVTTGASKQRQRLGEREGHKEKIDTIREGKHDVIQQNTPEPRPGYGDDED